MSVVHRQLHETKTILEGVIFQTGCVWMRVGALCRLYYHGCCFVLDVLFTVLWGQVHVHCQMLVCFLAFGKGCRQWPGPSFNQGSCTIFKVKLMLLKTFSRPQKYYVRPQTNWNNFFDIKWWIYWVLTYFTIWLEWMVFAHLVKNPQVEKFCVY